MQLPVRAGVQSGVADSVPIRPAPARGISYEPVAAGTHNALLWLVMRMVRWVVTFRKAVLLAFEHDMLNTAKAAAYSGMLMLFPTMVVVTTLLALVPEGSSIMGQIRITFMSFLPADTYTLLLSSMQAKRLLSAQLVFSATILSVFAGLGMMLSLMEGFRRAYRLPRTEWRFWERRMRALLLVPMVHVPLALATLLLVFGHQIEHWMIKNSAHELRPRGSVLLAHGALGDRTGDQRDRAGRTLSLRDEAQGTLVVRDAGCDWSDRGVVSGDTRLRLVCHYIRQLFAILRSVWGGDRDAGVALSDFIQRIAGSRAERCPLSSAP